MQKKILIFAFLFLINVIFVFSRGHHFGYYPHFHFYPGYYNDRDYFFVQNYPIYVHRMGNINLDKDMTVDLTDISSIVFYYGINGAYGSVERKEVYFTESGEDKILKNLVEQLDTLKIPDRYPRYDNLISYSIEKDILKLKFSNSNFYDQDLPFEAEEYYFYNLNFSLVMPVSDSIKSQFNELLSDKFKNDVKKYRIRQENMNIAGISVFTAGFGLAGLLNIAGLITYFNYRAGGVVPLAVPGSLFFSAIGSAGISLSVGIPLWAASYAKKKYTVKFQQ